jgi:F-type H+-transporting ATPase subunit a
MATEPIGPYAIRQFEIDILVPLNAFGWDISFTISSQAMLTTVIAAGSYFYLAAREGKLVPGRLQSSAEWIYTFVEDTLTRFGGPEARRTLPFFLTLFLFILLGSLIGLTPLKFTFTSHLIVTLGLALAVFAYVNILAVKTQGTGFFRFFMPPGTPLYLAPPIVTIELVSYVFRPVTLGLRLSANILAGHIMLKLFGDFCVMLTDALGGAGFAAAMIPLSAMVLMYFVEVGVIAIQAYIFLVLSAIYVKDALHGH